MRGVEEAKINQYSTCLVLNEDTMLIVFVWVIFKTYYTKNFADLQRKKPVYAACQLQLVCCLGVKVVHEKHTCHITVQYINGCVQDII